VTNSNYSVYMTNGYRYVGPQGIKNYSSGSGGSSTTSFPFSW